MKRILTTLSQKWPEYLLEILVITIGILGAFTLNNWKESKADFAKRQALVETLISEFENNREQLEVVIAEHQNTIAASNSWIALSLNPSNISQKHGDSLLTAIYSAWTFNPLNGALRTGISSGDIHLIKEDSLLAMLFSWEDLAKDAIEDEIQASDHLMNNLDKYNPNLSWTSLIAGEDYDASGIPSNYSELLADPEFRNFVAVHKAHNWASLSELYYVKKVNEKIIKQLKALIQ